MKVLIFDVYKYLAVKYICVSLWFFFFLFLYITCHQITYKRPKIKDKTESVRGSNYFNEMYMPSHEMFRLMDVPGIN